MFGSRAKTLILICFALECERDTFRYFPPLLSMFSVALSRKKTFRIKDVN